VIRRDNVTTRRLLAGHRFNVHCFNNDGGQFVEVFRDTWKRLPLRVRRAMCGFWRQGTTEYEPQIELSDCWSPESSYAQVTRAGMEVKFRQEAFACFPREAAQWIIAHELAHVFQKACGRVPGGDAESENEKHADDLAREWGFDQGCLCAIHMLQDHDDLSFTDACNELRERCAG